MVLVEGGICHAEGRDDLSARIFYRCRHRADLRHILPPIQGIPLFPDLRQFPGDIIFPDGGFCIVGSLQHIVPSDGLAAQAAHQHLARSPV